jgi:hypothetical protein
MKVISFATFMRFFPLYLRLLQFSVGPLTQPHLAGMMRSGATAIKVRF